MLEVLEKVKDITPEQYVHLQKEEKISAHTGALLEILKLLLKIKSSEHGVASKLIASEDDLLHLIKGKSNPLLKGWRYDIFGRDAIGVCEGRLCIGFDKENQKISISERCAILAPTVQNNKTENEE